MKKLKIVEQDIHFLLGRRNGFGTNSTLQLGQVLQVTYNDENIYTGIVIDDGLLSRDNITRILFDDGEIIDYSYIVQQGYKIQISNVLEISKKIIDQYNKIIIKKISAEERKEQFQKLFQSIMDNPVTKSIQSPGSQSPGSQSPGSPSSQKIIHDINITVDLSPIQVKALHVLELSDMIKDFFKSTTLETSKRKRNDDTRRYIFNNRETQREVLERKITEILKTIGKIKGKNEKFDDFVFNTTNDILGIKIISLKNFIDQLSENYNLNKVESYRYKTFFYTLLITLTNTDESDKQDTIIDDFINCFKTNDKFKLLTQFSDKYETKQTLYWVDATAGDKMYPELYDYIRYLKTKKLIRGFFTPAMAIDNSAKYNEAFEMSKGKNTMYLEYLKPDITNIIFGTRTQELVNVEIEKIKVRRSREYKYEFEQENKKQVEEEYTLSIKKFYGINCNRFDNNIKDIWNPSTEKEKRGYINISEVIKKLNKEIFKNGKDVIDDEELDICIKANKTLMDFLKQVYAADYINKSGDNMVSVFNDQNAARIMNILSKGLVVYTVKSDRNIGNTRIVLTDQIYSKLIASGITQQTAQISQSEDPGPDLLDALNEAEGPLLTAQFLNEARDNDVRREENIKKTKILRTPSGGSQSSDIVEPQQPTSTGNYTYPAETVGPSRQSSKIAQINGGEDRQGLEVTSPQRTNRAIETSAELVDVNIAPDKQFLTDEQALKMLDQAQQQREQERTDPIYLQENKRKSNWDPIAAAAKRVSGNLYRSVATTCTTIFELFKSKNDFEKFRKYLIKERIDIKELEKNCKLLEEYDKWVRIRQFNIGKRKSSFGSLSLSFIEKEIRYLQNL
jgi:hypothetical protein